MGILSRPANRRLTQRELAARQAGTAAKVKDAILGPPVTFDQNRRKFLENAACVCVAAIPGVALAAKLYKDAELRHEVVAMVEEVLADPVLIETVPAGYLIPEDERSGSDIMLCINPEYSHIPFYGFNFNAELDQTAGSVISALEASTTVHATVPTGTREEFLELAKERYPALNFVVYEMPVNPMVGYIQDVIFATGSKDNGRFVLASSTLDAGEFKHLPHYEPPQQPWINGDKIKHYLADQNARMKAIAGINLLGDEMLARDNPTSFKAHMVPVKLEGGDLDPIRLPNCKVALMVGPLNVINSIIDLANAEAGTKRYTANEVEGFSKMPREVFMKFFEQLKEDYKKYLGVSEVIFVDEKNIRFISEYYEEIPLKALLPQLFFHTDMAVKVATDGNGKPVAFCTVHDNPTDRDYLRRVRDQFAALGYEIVDLPCGPFATVNYTNGLMYTKNNEKVVVMPAYGIDEDAAAEKAYLERGFRVLRADLSNVKYIDVAEMNNLGSVHCRAEVLA